MKLKICTSSDQLADWTANYIRSFIQKFAPTAHQPFVLGLPTGSTPLKLYQKLIQFYQQGSLSFQNIVTFNLDEYVGIPKNHPESYHSYMFANLWSKVDIPKENIHFLNGNADDLEQECKDYEAQIQAYGGINLLIGGVGANGHIAFNEPGSDFQSRTQVKPLTESTLKANSRFFGGQIEQVPKFALTMGIKTLLEAKQVIILAQGQQKAQAIHVALEEKVTPLWPISALQLHPHSMIVCDEAATSALKPETIAYFQKVAHQPVIL